MKVNYLVLVLTSIILAVSGTCASSALIAPESKVPMNYFFDTSFPSSPSSRIISISCQSFEWFRAYFSEVSRCGHDLNQEFEDGNTLLHLSVKERCVNMVKGLIENDVDVFKVNSYSSNESALQVAYDLAARQENNGILEVFYSYGFELDIDTEKVSGKVDDVESIEENVSGELDFDILSVFAESLPIPLLYLPKFSISIPLQNSVADEQFPEI